MRRLRVSVGRWPAVFGPRDLEYRLEVEHPDFRDTWLPLWPIKSVDL